MTRAELLLIATKAQVRRKGYASEIAREMQLELTTLGVKEVFLRCVRAILLLSIFIKRSDTRSLLFGRNTTSPIEDAILFKLPLTDCQPNYSGLE